MNLENLIKKWNNKIALSNSEIHEINNEGKLAVEDLRLIKNISAKLIIYKEIISDLKKLK